MERTKYHNISTLERLALDAFKSSAFLIVNKTLIKKLDPTGAIILSNYLDKYDYFKKKNPEFEGWFYLTYAQQTEQTEINEYTLSIWRKKLQELGILEIHRRGLPAKDWYTINFKNLVSFLYDKKEDTRPPVYGGDLYSSRQGGLIKETKYKETKIKNLIKKDDDPWQDLFNQWYLYKKEKGQTYKPRGRNTFEAHLVEISKNNIDTAKQIINQSIANNYAGIWPLKNGYNKPESVKFKDSTVWTF